MSWLIAKQKKITILILIDLFLGIYFLAKMSIFSIVLMFYIETSNLLLDIVMGISSDFKDLVINWVIKKMGILID